MVRSDAIFMSDRQRVIGREHVDPGQRAPRAADHVEVAALAALAQARFLERRPKLVARGALAAIACAQAKHAQR